MFAHFAGWSTAAVLAVAGLVLVAESGLVIGLVLPGLTMLIALGLWAGTDGGSLIGALVAAPTATVLGAHLGYLRGRVRADVLRPIWAPAWLSGLITGRGPLATVAAMMCGHWTVAARLWLPRAAGRRRVPYRIFGPAVTVSGWLWASTFILLSHLLGRQVAERTGWAVLLGVIVLAVAVAVVTRARLPERDTRTSHC